MVTRSPTHLCQISAGPMEWGEPVIAFQGSGMGHLVPCADSHALTVREAQAAFAHQMSFRWPQYNDRGMGTSAHM